MLMGELRQFTKLSLSHVVYENAAFSQQRRSVKEGEFFIVLADHELAVRIATKVLLNDGIGYLYFVSADNESKRV